PPGPPARPLRYALATAQADPRARPLPAMQPTEDAEDLLVITRIDPNAVVADRENGLAVCFGSRNLNPRRIRSTKFDRVRNQLAKQLGQAPEVEVDLRK